MTAEIHMSDFIQNHHLVKDGTVDLICADPPYNISNDTVIVDTHTKPGHERKIVKDFGEWDHRSVKIEEWVPLAIRKLTPVGVFVSFYDKGKMGKMVDILEGSGLKIRHIACWKKDNPLPEFRKVKWQNATEHFVIATMNEKTGHHYNYKEGQHPDWISTPICAGHERVVGPDGAIHPTQKPEKVVEDIIRWWSFPNDTILDPFCGTGTTLAVGARLGRNVIGFENDPKWEQTIRGRTEKWVMQERFF